MVHALLADGAEQETGEATATSRPDDKGLGVRARVE
jgi:hypothetical protein